MDCRVANPRLVPACWHIFICFNSSQSAWKLESSALKASLMWPGNRVCRVQWIKGHKPNCVLAFAFHVSSEKNRSDNAVTLGGCSDVNDLDNCCASIFLRAMSFRFPRFLARNNNAKGQTRSSSAAAMSAGSVPTARCQALESIQCFSAVPWTVAYSHWVVVLPSKKVVPRYLHLCFGVSQLEMDARWKRIHQASFLHPAACCIAWIMVGHL